MKHRVAANILLLCLTACMGVGHSKAPTIMHFTGSARQRAEITGEIGGRSVLIVAHGDPRRGLGMQADCELHARENGSPTWRLVPFDSEIMRIDAEDIQKTSFSLTWETPKRFVVQTDFDLCAEGISFNGTYRAN